MEVRDGQAEAGGRLEAARGRVHADCGRSERIGGWEEEGSPVLAIRIGRGWWACKDVVPSA